eukprot:g1731.t1
MGSSTNMLINGMAGVYSFFGLTLAVAPRQFWGPESPMAYWTVMDESGEWFARAAGVWMTCVTLSPWLFGISKTNLAKLYLPVNLIFTGLFAQAAFMMKVTGPGKNAMLPDLNLWWTQVPISVVFLLLNLAAVSEGEKAKKV